MGKYASKVVGQAQSWLGYNEADGSHKQIIDTYNAHKPLARGYKVKYTDATEDEVRENVVAFTDKLKESGVLA